MDTARIHRNQQQDHHLHACTDGLVYMSFTVFDDEVGDEVEHIEVIPCRRCAISNEEDKHDHDVDELLA